MSRQAPRSPSQLASNRIRLRDCLGDDVWPQGKRLSRAGTWSAPARRRRLLIAPTRRDLEIGPVAQHAGDRPLVWIDDELHTDVFKWAEHREAPMLLIRPTGSVGLRQDRFDQIRHFANEVASTNLDSGFRIVVQGRRSPFVCSVSSSGPKTPDGER